MKALVHVVAVLGIWLCASVVGVVAVAVAGAEAASPGALPLAAGAAGAAAYSADAGESGGGEGGALAVGSPALAPREVDAFVAPLSDKEARALLIAELRSKAAAAEAAETAEARGNEFAMLLDQRRLAGDMMGERLGAIWEAWEVLPEQLELMRWLLTNVTPMEEGFALYTVAFLIALAAAYMAYRATRGLSRRWLGHDAKTWGKRLALVGSRFGLDLACVIVYLAVGLVATSVLFESNDPMRLLSEAFISAEGVTLFVFILARFLFAAHAPQYRLFAMSDRVAVRATFLAVVIAFVFATTKSAIGLIQLLGGGEELVAILRLAVTGFSIVFGILYLLSARVDPPAKPFWRAWPWLGLVVLLLASAQWTVNSILGTRYDNAPTLFGLVLFLAMPVVNASLRVALRPREMEGEAENGETENGETENGETRQFVVETVRRLALFIWAGLVIGFFAQGAGVPLGTLLRTPEGYALVQAIVRVVLTVAAGAVIWVLLRNWIDRWIAREKAIALANADSIGMGEGEGGNAIIGTRAQTLLPLFRATMLVLIIAIAFMMVLSSIGVDIGPLLAGAGVIGIAIGFGAQALVRDVVSGIFFLIDDAFRVGEYLEIDNLRGEVEKISIRSMQLRHHRGMVQTIPFGELRHITNYSRDWVIYKQDFLVPFETDIEFVRKMIKKLGQELIKNPDYGHLFIEPLKSQGVTRIEEAGMVVRTKFTCKPRQQFLLRRYVNLNIQRKFMEHGIQFARRRIQVEGADGRPVEGDGASAAQVVLDQQANQASAG